MGDLITKYTTESATVERVTLVGPMRDRDALYEELNAGGWRTTRCGPYTDRETWPEVDCERFLIVAEREVGR